MIVKQNRDNTAHKEQTGYYPVCNNKIFILLLLMLKLVKLEIRNKKTTLRITW